MNIGDKELEALPKEKLIEIIKMLSKNWHTLDGLWFRAVEEEFGFDVALKLDYKMWEKGPVIESRRIKELFNLSGGGPAAVVKAINFMSWAPATGYTYEELPGGKVVWTCTTCPPQDARKRQGLGENLCKPPGVSCFTAIAQAIDPAVKVNCLVCPPDPHPEDYWCKWEFYK